MWFCLYCCFIEISCQGHLQILMNTCLSATPDTCPHPPWGNILFFGFCDTPHIFFLPLSVFSHFLCWFFLLYSTCMCYIFQGSLYFTFCTLTIGDIIYAIGFKTIYVLLASTFVSPALTLLKLWSCIYSY